MYDLCEDQSGECPYLLSKYLRMVDRLICITVFESVTGYYSIAADVDVHGGTVDTDFHSTCETSLLIVQMCEV